MNHQPLRYTEMISEELRNLTKSGHYDETNQFIQHGNISVYEHCLSVAITACRIAYFLRIRVNYQELIRGALLHDYFLYDWHEDDKSHRLHGFYHPGIACKNAIRDYQIGTIETEIIRKHMFPLTPIPPRCREAWVVCLADKICATKETVYGFFLRALNL